MAYKNAEKVLPLHLIEEIQKYIDGGLIYIPKTAQKAEWGSVSGTRKSIDKRNQEIYQLYINGTAVYKLAQMFYLSEETIKKIVYGRKKEI